MPNVILPPCTTGDNAEPTHSIQDDVHRVFSLIQDERILTAHSLYTTVERRLDEYKRKQQKQAEKEKTSPTKRLYQHLLIHPHRTKATTEEQQHYTNTTAAEEEEYRTAMDLVEARREELNNMIVRCCCRCCCCRHFLLSTFCVVSYHCAVTLVCSNVLK